MIKNLLKLLFFCSFFLIQSFVFSQTEYSVRHFTIEDGVLSNRSISICRDGQGFHWVGSEKGLQQFDGYVFRSFPIVNRPELNTTQYRVYYQEKIDAKRMLFATSIGLLVYSYHTGQLNWLSIDNDSSLYETFKICSVNDSLYMIGSYGLLVYNSKTNIVKPASGKIGAFFKNNHLPYINNGFESSLIIEHDRKFYEVNYLKQTIQSFNQGTLPYSSHINKTCIDSQNVLWLATESGIYMQKKGEIIKRYLAIDKYCAVKDQISIDIAPCNDSIVIASVDWQGVFFINTRTQKIIAVLRNEKDKFWGFSSNAFNKLYYNNEESFWVSSNDGVNLVQSNNSGIRFYQKNLQSNLQSSMISKILEDSHGTIWIATDGGGLYSFSLITKQFTSYLRENALSNSPGSNMIVDLYEERSGENLWIGTYNGGLSCYNYASKQFKNYLYQADKKNGILNNNIYSITEDNKNNLLVNALCESISILDRKTNMWTHVTKENGEIECVCIMVLLNDSEGRVWTGGAGCGLNQFRSDKKVATSTPDVVHCLLNDNDYIWVGTSNGLKKFDKKNYCYVDFEGSKMFKNKIINCAYLDDAQQIWIGADNILYVYDKKTGKATYSYFNRYFKGYDIKTITKTKSGYLLIGAQNGLLVIPPDAINSKETANFQVSLSEMRLFGNAIQPNKNAIINTHCNFLQNINLPYNKNYLGFSFSVLQPELVSDIIYSCKLIGLDKSWIQLDVNSNRIEYSNLQPGNYTLYIRAMNKYNYAIFSEKKLSIHILPPFWKTWWFITIIIICIITCIFLYFYYRIRGLRKQQIVLEKAVIARTQQVVNQKEELATQAEMLENQYVSLKESKNQLELVVAELQRSDATKNKLFSIIAHDLKSPFSGIFGVITFLHKNFDDFSDERKKELLEASSISMQSIQILIDNLLQWSKSQLNGIALHETTISISELLFNTSNPLLLSLKNKNITFQIQAIDSIYIHADYETMSTVIRNIIQNAIKFCPQNGAISISAIVIDESVRIDIKDTGYGMDKELIDKILYATNSQSQIGTFGETGTGLGLEICKDFIQINKGKLLISSQKGKGSVVSILLPIVNHICNSKESPVKEEMKTNPKIFIKSLPSDTVLLIVDDNPIIRDHLISLFRNSITIIEANNGQIGFEKALEYIPDIIISDVAMPVMDGCEMSKKITSTLETSHIPIILLTAKADSNSRIEGLSSGAIDYLTKPFGEDELFLKLYNILSVRKQRTQYIQEHFKASYNHDFSEDPFLNKLFLCIDENISEPDFGVEQLSLLMSMSRSTFSRKVKAIINKSPNDIIIEYRLQKAKEILTTHQFRVSEVAYQVGFNDPKYFTRKFKKMYGKTPSDI